MNGRLKFLIRFLALTALLFLVWIPIGEKYLDLLAWVSKYVLLLLGYHVEVVTGKTLLAMGYNVGASETPFFLCQGVIIGMESHAQLSNFNLVPLIALILATPGVLPMRRVKVLLIGLFILFCAHIVDLASHVPMYCGGSEAWETVVIFMSVSRVAVPFVLWFVLVKREILGAVRRHE
ncbi:hypothetical protein AIOGIFDO_01345 [Candidatus Methanoperedenaceae archaeon GB37]|nr:hypothetical protein AIOGIFDO_01345 [Candidatus Methanoperedenaceae archaeon GB37]